MSYTISTVPFGAVSSDINATVKANDHSSCTSTSCKYCVKNFTVMSAPTYTIFITANDLLSDEYTEKTECTDGPISKDYKYSWKGELLHCLISLEYLLKTKVKQKQLDVSLFCIIFVFSQVL